MFQNQTNYAAFVERIAWREQMRDYVMDAQAAWSATNAPIISPMFLLFPGDAVCGFTADASDGACAAQFMFGRDWLAKPITRYGQTSSWVYLPALPRGQSWVSFFERRDYGGFAQNATMDTPVAVFPLFYRNYAASTAGGAQGRNAGAGGRLTD